MRRILMFMGIALLAFPLVAVGAVKVRSRTAGYPLWDVPAGKALAKGFKAPVKAGPFTLGFHTQIEMNFESMHQLDFSEDVADGQTNNGVGGAAGVNTLVGLGVPADVQKGDEFLTEFRFGMDAVAGPFSTHIVLENPRGVSDASNETSAIGFERAWGDIDLGWFNLRFGTQLYSLEPTLMLYGDDDQMITLYKNTGDFAWRINYMKRRDADEALAGNGIGGLVPGDFRGSDARPEGTNNDVDIVMVIVEIPFANPLGPGTMSVQPFYVLDHDKRFKVPGVTLADGSDFDGVIESHYLGATFIGNLGPLKAVISGAYNFGTDNTGFNAVNSATGFPRDDVDIRAWQAFAELAWPVPGIPLTISAGAYLASGDDDPFDDTANGWLGVDHNSEMFGGNDIFIDKSEDGGSITIRQQATVAGVATTNAGPAVFLSGDDEAILQGLSSFNNVACAAAVGAPCTAAGVGFHPSRTAAAPPAGPGGAALPTSGSASSALDPYSVNNRSHPGIAIANLALKYKLLKNATITGDYQHIRLLNPDGLSPLAAPNVVRPVSGILTQGAGIDGHFGDQFGIHLVWKPAKYVTIDPRFIVLIPGDAVKDLTGEDDTAWAFKLGMRWNF